MFYKIFCSKVKLKFSIQTEKIIIKLLNKALKKGLNFREFEYIVKSCFPLVMFDPRVKIPNSEEYKKAREKASIDI